MFSRKLAVLAAFGLFFTGFTIQPVFAGHDGKMPCPMTKGSHSASMERTAGSVPVYGGRKKCPMDHHGSKADMKKGDGMHDGHMGHMNHSKRAHAGHVSADMSYGGPEAKALDEVMATMHRDMAVPYTGDADADFIRGMIPHHQGAIDMARVVLEYGDDPQAQQLARNIIRAQKGEIAWMKRWLKERQLPQKASIDLRK